LYALIPWRFRIHVAFNDNSENTIDFQKWLHGPIFEPLKNPAYFSAVFVDGGTVVCRRR